MQKTVNDAEKKIREGVKDVKSQHGRAVAPSVADMLCSFCRQNDGFAAAVIDRGATFAECVDEIMKGVGSSISDVELYRRAVQFWLEGADVEAQLRVVLPDGKSPDVREKRKSTVQILSLEELL